MRWIGQAYPEEGPDALDKSLSPRVLVEFRLSFENSAKTQQKNVRQVHHATVHLEPCTDESQILRQLDF